MSFPGSGASTYTLDSGIGTFPLPDCSGGAAGRGLSKTRADHRSSSSPGRAGRRARTLDRELTSQDESYASHKQPVPPGQYGALLEGRTSAGVIHEGDHAAQRRRSRRCSAAIKMSPMCPPADKDAHGSNVFSPRSKTWTFPSLKTPAGPAEVYLAVEEEEEEEVSFGSAFRGVSVQTGPAVPISFSCINARRVSVARLAAAGD